MLRTLPAGMAVAVLLAAPAGAQDRPPFAPVVETLVDTVVVPAHETFATAAGRQAGRVAGLCEAPDAEALRVAREGFGTLLSAFGAVEPYRFGPAREENRVERLFFWPDRRGRGLRQVQTTLAERDPSATDPATLAGKSVALQGLPALEYALFGSGSGALASGTADHRCAYAEAVSAGIANVADALAAAWRGPFRGTMLEAGPANPAYRSHGEALQDLLQAAAEQLEFVARFKLGPAVGDGPADARPRLAPFWRSGGTLAMVVANLEAVDALLAGEIAGLLGEDAHLVDSARFELARALEILRPLAMDPRPFEALVADEDAHRRLAYARIPLGGAAVILSQRIPAALGLVAGFNALDGD